MACSGSTDDASPPPREHATATTGAPATAPATADALLSAAFRDLATSGDTYAELHHQYLGVSQPAPDTSSCAPWPTGDVGTRTLRLGYVVEAPLHTVDASGQHVGFEADLAAELIRRINAHYRGADVTLEWVPVDVTLPIGPTKNSTEFGALAAGLRADRFDVAFSSVVPITAPDITYLCPTMTMFPGVVYTGLDGLDVSGIHDRASLVAFLVAHTGMTFVHGMGVGVYDALASDVAAAGGSISLAPAGSEPHFRMADIVGLSKLGTGTTSAGTLLDVNPRTDVQPRATFPARAGLTELLGVPHPVRRGDAPVVDVEGRRQVSYTVGGDHEARLAVDDLHRQPICDARDHVRHEAGHPVATSDRTACRLGVPSSVAHEHDVRSQQVEEAVEVAVAGCGDESLDEVSVHRRVHRQARPTVGDPTPRSDDELSAPRLGAFERPPDLVVPEPEHVVEQERGTLHRSERLQHDQQPVRQ